MDKKVAFTLLAIVLLTIILVSVFLETSHVARADDQLNVSIAPTPWTMDFRQEQNFTASVSGGRGPYTYQWVLNDSAVGNSTTYTFYANSTVGLFVLYVNVTDSVPETVQSNITSITVNPALTAPPISASAEIVDQGETSVLSNSSAVTTGTAPYSYQWFRKAPSGSYEMVVGNSPSYSFVTTTSTAVGVWGFILQVNDSTGSAVNSTVPVTVNSALVAPSLTPSPGAVDQEQTLTLSSSAVTTGTLPYTYNWFYETPTTSSYALTVATSSSYNFATSTSTKNGGWKFILQVTDGTGAAVNSSAATITVDYPPSILTQPSSATIDNNQSITLSSEVDGGTGTFSWAWYDTGGPLSGATGLGTTATHVFSTAVAGIYVIFTDTGTSSGAAPTKTATSSPTVVVTLDPSPSIYTQPSSATIDSGQSITLSSTVTGGTGHFSWQWYNHAGTVVSGGSGTGATATHIFSTADSGYYVVFTDTGTTSGAAPTATATSNGAAVAVDTAPSVSVEPSSATLDNGQQVIMNSTVSAGTGSFSWKWYDTGGAISGATGSGKIATHDFSTAATDIYVVFTDTGVTSGAAPTANATSSTASVTVNSALSASVTPSSLVLDSGQSVTLTVAPSDGTSPYSYQWYVNGSAVSGATSASYSWSPLASTAAYCKVTDSASSPVTVSSTMASITVDPAPSISTQPSSSTIDNEQSITLSSKVTDGTGSFSWQWYNHAGTAVSGGYGSGTTASLSVSTADSGYYVVFTDTGDTSGATPLATATSNGASVTIDTAPSISAEPITAIIDSGQSISLSSTAAHGTGTFSWTWYDNSGAISGATGTGTTATHVFSVTDTGIYVIFTDTGVTSGATPAATTTSNSVSVTVDTAPSISVEPSSAAIDSGQSITLSATVIGGTGTFSWVWYDSGGAISGATGSGMTATHAFSTGDTGIYVAFTDAGTTSGATPTETARSSPVVSVKLSPAPTVSVAPTSWMMDVAQSKTFVASASGGSGSLSYQWYLSGSPVSGENSSTYMFTASFSGSPIIYCTVTDQASTPEVVQSNTPSVTIYPILSIPVASPAYWTMDVGQTKVFSVSVSGGSGTLHYQWYVDNVAVGIDSASYSYTAATGLHLINCTVTDSASDPASAVSNIAEVAVGNGLVAPFVSASPATVDQGQTSILSNSSVVNTGSSPYTYQWFSEAPGASSYSFISGADSSSYNFVTNGSTTQGTWHFILQVTDSTNAMVNSSAAAVTVNSTLVASTVTPSPAAVNPGQTSVLSSSAVTSGTSPYTYQWFEKASGASSYSSVAGATSSSYDFATLASATAGSYSFILQVTDSTGAAVNSTAASVTVNAPVPTPSPSPSPTASPTPAPTQTPTPTPTPTSTPPSGASASSTVTVTANSATVNQVEKTGVSVTVSGSSLPNGAQLTVTSTNYGASQPTATGAVSVIGAAFYDVKVSSSSGNLGSGVTAVLSFSNPIFNSASVIEYWNGNKWVSVTTTFTAPNTVSGTIPASALVGLSILVGVPESSPTSPLLIIIIVTTIAAAVIFGNVFLWMKIRGTKKTPQQLTSQLLDSTSPQKPAPTPAATRQPAPPPTETRKLTPSPTDTRQPNPKPTRQVTSAPLETPRAGTKENKKPTVPKSKNGDDLPSRFSDLLLSSEKEMEKSLREAEAISVKKGFGEYLTSYLSVLSSFSDGLFNDLKTRFDAKLSEDLLNNLKMELKILNNKAEALRGLQELDPTNRESSKKVRDLVNSVAANLWELKQQIEPHLKKSTAKEAQ